MKLKVLENTYPKYPNIPHAEPGDVVHWEHGKSFNLVRDSDGETVFSTAPVDRNGRLRSNMQHPVSIGIIAQVKSRGWILRIGEESP